MITITFIKYS